ncbi:MAG: ATP-binding protein [Bradymonadia bacterium]
MTSLVSNPFRLVLTGGPCGGKTTSLAQLRERLESAGYAVFVVPEIPSILIGGGANLGGLSAQDFRVFETNVLSLQLGFENAFIDLARADSKRSVIIYDRGLMDPSAYVTSELWSELLESNGWTEEGLCDDRYDLVIHLTSASIGAPDHYVWSLEGIRKEPPELAADLDQKVERAWRRHPEHHVIDNSTNFDEKLERVWALIAQRLSI